MGQLQRILDEQIRNAPKLMLQRLLERKLKAQRIELPAEALEALSDHLLSGKVEKFAWDDGAFDPEPRLFELNFDENDATEVERLSNRLTLTLPEIVENISEKFGTDLFNVCRKNWDVEGAIQRYEINEFQDRLEVRWGEGVQLLRMLLTIVRELGHEEIKRFKKSKSKKHAYRRYVLTHLHVRSCQVADESITLMENGFADGAMARWRTLHELSVVATLIADGDEELASRYIQHDVVEVKKHADDYDTTLVPLGYPPIAPRERKRIEKHYADVIQRYGKPFGTDYGWAATYLNDRRPTFQRLQSSADQSGMSSYYKLANWNIHAGARSMFFRLTDMGTNIPIAGRSNAGLVEPGQNTAFTLIRITGALLGRPKNLDRIIETKALLAMRDAVPKALHRADRKLQRDEANVQKERKRKAAARRRGGLTVRS